MEIKMSAVLLTFVFLVSFGLMLQYCFNNISPVETNNSVTIEVIDNSTVAAFYDFKNSTEDVRNKIVNTTVGLDVFNVFGLASGVFFKVLPDMVKLVLSVPNAIYNLFFGPTSILSTFIPSQILSIISTVFGLTIVVLLIFWIVNKR